MKYERKLKTDWKAEWIWADSEKDSKNVWVCFNKTVELTQLPGKLVADIHSHKRECVRDIKR